VSKVS